ncbi:PTS sugar transporter subunit IIB [Fundicoccus culcitae]|uniref:PTS sugar transporter subunit IIB n=1 Tax=Fundicoccus culcitae TaxID=2969821 RepID=A0ABY5P4Y4_9LACT|nr:PTS sugar transporter subunit IIB [Fundicoccus culcitae]UUX33754.1 PTS sugar transporter subunit IIB [Fundicoccus culcitae]
MKKGIVVCRTGTGSSVMLKIQADKVIKTNNLPISLEQASLDAIPGFSGDLIIALSDVADDLSEKHLKQYIIGINNMMNKNELLEKMNMFLTEIEEEK